MSNPYFHNPDIGPLNDFKFFLFRVWNALGYPKPTRAQYLIADYLGEGEPSKILMAFRGVGKSYTSTAYVCWLWLINPDWKISVISASAERAKEFTQLVRSLIDMMPELSHLKPGKGQLDSAFKFEVGPAKPAKDASLSCYGITGQITGGRADHVIADDIEIPLNSDTVGKREKLLKLCAEFTNILKPEPWTTITFLGTPQTEQSVYIGLEQRGFRICVIPAEYPKDAAVYAGRLHPTIEREMIADPRLVGTAVDPERFDDSVLHRKKYEIGPTAYELQFQLNPSLSDEDRYPLKLRDFVVMSVSPELGPSNVVWAADKRTMIDSQRFPLVGFNSDRFYAPAHVGEQWLPYDSKIMAIDPKGRGGDELAYCVLYFLKGYVHVAAWSALKGGYEEDNLRALSNIAKQHNVNTLLVEDNYGDGMFAALLKPVLNRIHPCPIEDFHANNQQKHARICDVLEPVLSRHRIILDEQVIIEDNKAPRDELKGLWQLTRITRERNSLRKDDRIDVLHMGVKWYQDYLAIDVEENERQAKEAQDAKDLEVFLRDVYGDRFAEDNYDVREVGTHTGYDYALGR